MSRHGRPAKRRQASGAIPGPDEARSRVLRKALLLVVIVVFIVAAGTISWSDTAGQVLGTMS